MKKFCIEVNKNKGLLLLALPVVVWMALFCYIPMFGIILAFKDFDYSLGIFLSPWNGLKNFDILFKSKDAFVILRNTVLYNVAWIPLGIICAVFFAIMLDSVARRRVTGLSKVNQTLSILPHFLSWVVISYFADSFLNVDKGFLNQIIGVFGGTPKNWYNEIKYWPFILTILNLWKSVGYNSIVYYSTIRGFNKELYEAAYIDGASWFKQTTKITLPLLKPIVTIMGILALGGILNSDFGLFYIIPRNSGMLYPVTSTLDTYIYNAMTTGGDLGVTGAVNFFKSIIGFLLVISTNAITNKIDSDSALF